MLKIAQILVNARCIKNTKRNFSLGLCVFAFAGCGQKGALYLPTEPAAANRATLPEALNPNTRPLPVNPAPVPTPVPLSAKP